MESNLNRITEIPTNDKREEDQKDAESNIEVSKSLSSFDFDSGCAIFTEGAIQVPKFKFHDSSSGVQQIFTYDISCLSIGRVGLNAPPHFVPMAEKANDLLRHFAERG
ncbi:hypothetical protein ACTXT7_009189 [Hymenolepis weldensis]